jgi:uncharacterized membrane protein YjjB (DUF3815 family)
MDPGFRSNDVLVTLIERAKDRRQAIVRQRRQRRDAWLAATAMLGALLALPLAQTTWHGPEVAAVLAIAATAQFAGHRWAIAVIVIAELFLLPTVWPRAFLEGELESRVVALATLVAMVPSLLAMRRAAAVLAVLTGRRHPRVKRRLIHAGLMVSCVIAVVLPWV